MSKPRIRFCTRCRRPKRVLYKLGDQELCEVCLAEYVFDEDLVSSNDPNARVTAFDLSVLTESTWRFMPFKNFVYAIIFLCNKFGRTDSVSYELLLGLIRRANESEADVEQRVNEYIELFRGSLIDGIFEEEGEKRIKLSKKMQYIMEEYMKGRDEYAIGILESIVDNAVITGDIINSLIRKSFIDAIYTKISPDGTIRLDEVREVSSYQCKLCNMVFRAGEYDLLIDHLRHVHMVPPDQLKENYVAIMTTVGYKISDEAFRASAEKYGVAERTRIDRFTKALKYGALFNQDSIRTNENGEIEWIVKPEIVRYLKRVRELTLERTRTLERV